MSLGIEAKTDADVVLRLLSQSGFLRGGWGGERERESARARARACLCVCVCTDAEVMLLFYCRRSGTSTSVCVFPIHVCVFMC
jgi:hypothetical protein